MLSMQQIYRQYGSCIRIGNIHSFDRWNEIKMTQYMHYHIHIRIDQIFFWNRINVSYICVWMCIFIQTCVVNTIINVSNWRYIRIRCSIWIHLPSFVCMHYIHVKLADIGLQKNGIEHTSYPIPNRYPMLAIYVCIHYIETHIWDIPSILFRLHTILFFFYTCKCIEWMEHMGNQTWIYISITTYTWHVSIHSSLSSIFFNVATMRKNNYMFQKYTLYVYLIDNACI
jgi:hypothetical protein